MSDAIFNSFLKSVYGSGSSMHLFDGHIDGGMEIVGGADDISVESIFGISAGDCGNDDHSEDPIGGDCGNDDHSEDPIGGGDYTSEFSISVGYCDNDDHSEDPVGGGADYDDEEEDMKYKHKDKRVELDCISICIEPKKIKEVHAGQFTDQVNISCSGYRDNDDRSFLDDDSRQEENQETKESKKISSGSLTGGLTAQEVASLISIYRD